MKADKAKPKREAPPTPPPSFGRLYWLRLACGVLAGAASFEFFSQPPISFANTSNGILIGILGYLVTYYVARYVFYRKIQSELLTKLYTTGIGGYVMLFIFTWLLLFTLSSAGV